MSSSDIRKDHILFSSTPATWHPYIRLARMDRPIGTWLLLFPCLWSISLAHQGVLNMPLNAWVHVFLFCVGALLMRSAGCVINDLWDKDLDAQVSRTRSRPLASGEILPRQALVFLGVLLLISFAILLLLSATAILLGVASLALVISYPLMKRVTWWPQLFLGFTFNWGALMGWADAHNVLSLVPILLYIGGIFWTLAYDTVYAHQDKEDDALVGIKSTARLFGNNSKRYVLAFYILAIAFILQAKYIAFASFMTPILTGAVILQLVHHMRTWDINSPESCLAFFRAQHLFGWLILLLISF